MSVPALLFFGLLCVLGAILVKWFFQSLYLIGVVLYDTVKRK